MQTSEVMRIVPFAILLLAACERREQATAAPATVSELPAPVVPSAPPEALPGGSVDELTGARRALESYYEAINQRDFDRAFLLWSDSGRASRQSRESFRAGFSQTKSSRVTIGPGTLEGAAGSRYAEFSVQIEARSSTGAVEHFTGRYVLRRAVVDGATPAQRAWHIYSARVRRAP